MSDTDVLTLEPLVELLEVTVPEMDAAPASAAPKDQPQVRDPDRFTGHQVSLQLFDGPLDLLLYLIRAHRYDICDIPIHEITTQFMEYLTVMNEVDIEYAGDFLVTAATLMQIKVRMLLPKMESVNEEEMEGDEDDPRQALVDRLLEYQRLQEAAETLKDLGEERAVQFPRPPQQLQLFAADETDDVSQLLSDVSTFDLLRTLQRVLNRMKERPVALVRREPFSLAERTKGLLSRLAQFREPLTFDALCEDCESRVDVVVTFLVVLELIRRSRVLITQETVFGEIWVRVRPKSESPAVIMEAS
ncbi:MAG: segregation/condensation protein A [Abditibacteriaceae bacterium]